MKKLLTDAQIRNLLPPASGRLEVADQACRGLWLRVTAAGAKAFAFRYRGQGGHSERLTIGSYPDVSLRDARVKADKLRQQVAVGENPSAHRREAPARSFAALAERYLNEHARRFKRSADKDERNLRLHILPRWKNRDFKSITRADVIALVERLVSADKPVLANHVQRLISKIFAFAMDVALTEQNPAARLRLRGAVHAKDRVLNDAELRLFWKHIVEAPIPRTVGLALRLVLATGVRPGEAAGMTLSELELDNDGKPVSWTIPKERSKNGRAHFVPLSSSATAIISEAMALTTESDFIFASQAARGHADSSMLANMMAKLATGLPGNEPGAVSWKAEPPTPHDLRRTCSTRLAANGVPRQDVDAVLNHIDASVTGKHYDLYGRASEKRRALDRWSRVLTGIIKQAPASSNVVAMR